MVNQSLGDEALLLEDLNPQQRKAVQTLEGPLLILAGAGSGKTRVLTYRVALLILKKLAAPQNILAITFTNKAANEIKFRVLKLLQKINFTSFKSSLNLHTLWMSTFHSSCARILRQDIHHLGISNTFTIFDSSDQLKLVKKVLFHLKLDEKTYSPKLIVSKINQAKTRGLEPKDIERNSSEFPSDLFLNIYKVYEKDKGLLEALDFGDLLLKTYKLFTLFPDVLSRYQDLFKYVMIDEYQDTNFIQYKMAQKIALKHQNLCVTGDEDQSIYSWRGSDVRNILNFKRDFPKSKTVKLEQNYRSTQNIIEASQSLIQRNRLRQEKTLFTQNKKGNKIFLKELENETEEALFVVNKILSLTNSKKENSSFFPCDSFSEKHREIYKKEGEKGYNYGDFAIFYRTNAQSRILEDIMRRHFIPYKIVGGLRFYDRMEIKDMISYLKVILNQKDDLSLKRILNVPLRGIGQTTFEKIEEMAYKNRCSLFEAISKGLRDQLFSSQVLKKLKLFHSLIESLRERSKFLSPLDLYFLLLKETGYEAQLKKEASLESRERLKNLEELAYVIREFERKNLKNDGLREKGVIKDEELIKDDKKKKENRMIRDEKRTSLSSLLEELALTSDEGERKNDPHVVSLMTLHIAKGLEFSNVFITGLEEGLLPSVYNWDETRETALEEERRLFYVGMTRAKENLFLSYTIERQRWGREEIRSPSSFLDEIPEHLLEIEKINSHFSLKESFSFFKPSSHFSRHSSKEKTQYNQRSYLYSEDEAKKNSKYRQGMKVHHRLFGEGLIIKVEGSGKKKKLSVRFNISGKSKKFLAASPLISKI